MLIDHQHLVSQLIDHQQVRSVGFLLTRLGGFSVSGVGEFIVVIRAS